MQDAEEIVQEALMTISGRYREIEFTTSFAGWAHRVLVNKILDYFKAKGTRRRALTELAESSHGSEPPETNPRLKTRLLECLKTINRTNGRHARILAMHYQGYTTGEICEKLRITPNNFYVILSRARSMLAACLEKEDPA